MPDTYEGKLRLMELKTKLDDHTAQQAIDMGEIKATTIRIETKLDTKVDKDDLTKITTDINTKADKQHLDQLDSRFWQVLIIAITSLVGVAISLIKIFFGKL